LRKGVGGTLFRHRDRTTDAPAGAGPKNKIIRRKKTSFNHVIMEIPILHARLIGARLTGAAGRAARHGILSWHELHIIQG
jgi:hypothetical protein